MLPPALYYKHGAEGKDIRSSATARVSRAHKSLIQDILIMIIVKLSRGMKKRQLKVKIMLIESRPQRDDSDPDSEEGESVSEVFNELKQQMSQIDAIAKSLDTQVIDLYRRSTAETVDWMNEPLRARPHIQKWCVAHGLSSKPTMDEFTEVCFEAAKSMDLESRMLTFQKEDAAILWDGQRRLTVFELIARIPTLFE